MTQICDVMILCAHPDDAEFGAAGTVAHWVNEGKQVVYIISTNGDIGATFDRKIAALRCHKSQMKAYNSSDPFAWLRNRCRDMAQEESYELAEGFHRVELPQ